MTQTIVMIHGMMAGGWCWEGYKEFFEERGYRCITPNLRFHDMPPDKSPDLHLGALSLTDYVEDLEDEIGRLDELPVIIGHSLGGLLAQIIGSHGLVKALVLLTPASPRGILALRPSVIRTFWSAQTKWGFWTKPFRLTFKEMTYSILQLMPAEEQKKIYDKLVFESGRAVSEVGYWFFDHKRAAEVDEAKVKCPVLVIGASQDKATPISVVRKVAKKYGAVSSYKEFTGHSHWIIGEPGWQEVAEYVCSWLYQALTVLADNDGYRLNIPL